MKIIKKSVFFTLEDGTKKSEEFEGETGLIIFNKIRKFMRLDKSIVHYEF